VEVVTMIHANRSGAARRAPEADPHLRVVSPTAPPRPRWGALYLALGATGVIGTAAHFALENAVLVQVVDAVFALALFVTLGAWVRLNRTRLTRVDEPDAGTGRPDIHIVRSRRDEEVVLPYDFR
jgi:hypothetical protein